MTSTFDELMHLFQAGEINPAVRKVIEWLADICIPQANTREPGFTFETWLANPKNVYAHLYEDNPFMLKKEFLNECHDFLDHRNWHLRVFDRETVFLISTFHDAFFEAIFFQPGHEDDRYLKRKFPRYKEYLKILLQEREAVKNG